MSHACACVCATVWYACRAYIPALLPLPLLQFPAQISIENMLRMLYARSEREGECGRSGGRRQIKISRKTHLKPLAKLTHTQTHINTHEHTHADTQRKTIKWYSSHRRRSKGRQTDTHSGTAKEKGEDEGTGTGHLRTTYTIRVTVSI